jgi:hypothetical protein
MRVKKPVIRLLGLEIKKFPDVAAGGYRGLLNPTLSLLSIKKFAVVAWRTVVASDVLEYIVLF